MRIERNDKVYDLVVLGDEPAGLWCLKKYLDIHERLERSKSPKIPRFPRPQLGWFTKGSYEPIPVPLAIARHFGIKGSSPWSLEIASPKETFLWNAETIKARFPGLSVPQGVRPEPQALSAIRYTLRNNPEILGYAEGILRFFGKSQKLTPEGTIFSALLCHSIVWWNPWEKLDGVEQIPWDGKTPPAFTLKRHSKWVDRILEESIWNLKTAERTLQTRYVLWNTEKRDDVSTEDTFAEYPLDIEAKREMFNAELSPLVLYFDTEEIPEPYTEIWPIETRQSADSIHLRLWVRGKTEFDLNEMDRAFEEGMKRIHRLFPTLKSHLKQVAPTSSVEPLKRLRFAFSSIDARTALSDKIFSLASSYQCHLPYPLGTLKGARELLREFMGRKRVKWAEKEATTKRLEW